tara:strand:+ start:214 stop:441 length:228 start_codon:yes stop_codon:yes gene_type:complete
VPQTQSTVTCQPLLPGLLSDRAKPPRVAGRKAAARTASKPVQTWRAGLEPGRDIVPAVLSKKLTKLCKRSSKPLI